MKMTSIVNNNLKNSIIFEAAIMAIISSNALRLQFTIGLDSFKADYSHFYKA